MRYKLPVLFFGFASGAVDLKGVGGWRRTNADILCLYNAYWSQNDSREEK